MKFSISFCEVLLKDAIYKAIMDNTKTSDVAKIQKTVKCLWEPVFVCVHFNKV